MKGITAKTTRGCSVHTSYRKLLVLVLQYFCIEVRIDRNNFIFPPVYVLQHEKQAMTHLMEILGEKHRAGNHLE